MSMPERRPPGTQIEVMIVDDSAVVRQRLKSIIESDPRFRVVTAADPYEAVALLSKSVPGLILLDVEMPRMDGLTFLRKLMRQHPMPVVLCTDQAERAVTALEMGAIEVIAKPDWRDPAKMAAWGGNLLESIRNAARAGHLPMREDRPPSGEIQHNADAILSRVAYTARQVTDRIVAVGVSTGGVQAVQQLLCGFPADSPGMVIVQHMPPDFTGALASRLNSNPKISLEVVEAKHHEPIKPDGSWSFLVIRMAWFAAPAPGIASSWWKDRRFAGTARASRSSSARPRRRPDRTPRG